MIRAKQIAVGSPNMDLDGLIAARILVAGERYDRGATSVAEYEAEKAEIISNVTSQAAARGNNQAIADAATQQAYAASKPVSCTRIANTVSCY